jgi:hypothetical protein
MFVRNFALCLGLTLAGAPCFAQSSLTGPLLGRFFDPHIHAIRPILGIPGSAVVGGAIGVGFPMITAAISPQQGYALGISHDGAVDVIAFAASGPTVQVVQDTEGTPDRIVISPGGASAALYYGFANSVQILTGLPNAPQVIRQVDISSLPNAPNMEAISDDGTLLLEGVREGVSGSAPHGEVFLFTSDNTAPRSIAVVQNASALTFVPQSSGALIADNLAGSIMMVQNVASGANIAWTFTSQQLPAPDSVRASADGQSVLVGASTSGTVAILDASGANAVIVACGCEPSELHPLNTTSSIYQITEPANGLLWILDANASYPRIAFVPIPGDPPDRSTVRIPIGKRHVANE